VRIALATLATFIASASIPAQTVGPDVDAVLRQRAELDAKAKREEEQQEADWEKLVADSKEHDAQRARERERINAHPNEWAQTLEPLRNGGWRLLFVGHDPVEALFSSDHHRSQAGSTITLWLRSEFAEQQTARYPPYLSTAERDQIDCAGARLRLLSISYFPLNNLGGQPVQLEQTPQTATWYSVVPGSSQETLWKQVCEKRS
jgi:hypothetical protein